MNPFIQYDLDWRKTLQIYYVSRSQNDAAYPYILVTTLYVPALIVCFRICRSRRDFRNMTVSVSESGIQYNKNES